MNTWIGTWISLWRWRWWRDAGAEIARHRPPEVVPAGGDAIERLRAQMFRLLRVARWVPHSRCLDRALALVEWADAQGIPARLRVGVIREAEQLRAHAWVQSGAIILDPDPDSTARFIPLEAPPPCTMEFDR